MKKLLLKSLLLLCALVVGSANVWADDVTCTFSSRAWAADNGGTWTSGKDGGQLTSGRGVQVTTSSSGANGTSGNSFSDVSQIVVTYSTNASNGAGSIAVKVGSGTAQSQNVTKTGGTTDRTLTYNFSPKESGKVNITVTCTTNSIYVKSVKITYTPSSTPSSAAAFATNTPSINWPTTTTFTQTATTASGYTGTITYSIGSINTAGASINTSSGEVTVTQGGSVMVIATAPAITGFEESSASYTLTVNDVRANAGLSWSNTYVEILLDASSYTLPTLSNPNSLTVSYDKTGDVASVTSTGVVTVNTGTSGTSTIKAIFAGNTDYKPQTVTYTIEVIDPTVKGCKYNPYTVAEVIAINPSSTTAADQDKYKYVTGYIVGGFNSSSAFTQTSSEYQDTNLALADDSEESTAGNVIPISIPNNAIRTNFNVKDNPTHVGLTKVLLKGDIAKYFNVPGVKNVTYMTKSGECVKVSDAGLSTFASNSKLDFSGVTNLEAYIATTDGSTITLTKKNKIAAGTGMLLRSKTGAATFDVPVTTAATDDVTGNLFVRGTGAAVASGSNPYNYVLGKHNDVVGFYKAGGMTVATDKAYLQTSIAAARLELNFEDSEITGISEITSQKADSQIFDLQGRKVAAPSKGLYIVNGKKVIIK